jgi:hypothetical protein
MVMRITAKPQLRKMSLTIFWKSKYRCTIHRFRKTWKSTKGDAITLHVSEATMVVIKATNNPIRKA